MSTFAERLREAMSDSDVKQVALAEKLDSAQPYISQILNGKKMPSDRMIKDMAEILGVNFEWLSEGSGCKKPDLSREQAVAQLAEKILKNKPGSFVERVAMALAKADEEQLEAVERFLDMFYEKKE